MVACVSLALLSFSGCSSESLIGLPSEAPSDIVSAVVDSGQVTDLEVSAVTDSSVTIAWTEVDDGAGQPASYRLRYALPPITWQNASIGCASTIVGVQIGARLSCTVQGLVESTQYDFQLMSYRTRAGGWVGAVRSNVASGSTAAPAASPVPGGVTDLAVSLIGPTSLTLTWTQVDDGTGAPADYRVKYAIPSINYGSATIGCDRTIEGTAIGAVMSCNIGGLAPGTTYDVQLMSYRTDSTGVWVDALRSNVATAATLTPTVSQTVPDGIWTSAAELAARPTSGPDWDRLLSDAARDAGVADIGDQDSRHDVYTLAAALVCVRTGEYCGKARRGVLDAMYTEEDPSDADGDWIPMARWMAVGRNLGSYVIAADLLDLRRGGGTGTDGERVQEWIESFLTKDLMDSNDRTLERGWEPFSSGSNGAAQQGFAYAAVVAYLGDRSGLDFIWQAFRTFVCDAGAVDVTNIYLTPPVRDGWTDRASPCAVNPKGSTMRVPSGLRGAGRTYRIDGSLSADMRRGGVFQWEPGYTQYPWVGLEGLVPAAVILERAGYPAFAAGDRAVLRTHEYLSWLRNRTGDTRWFDGVRASEIVHLVNVAYGVRFPINRTTGQGRTVGYTGWTHPAG
jgi:hypothetical protein